MSDNKPGKRIISGLKIRFTHPYILSVSIARKIFGQFESHGVIEPWVLKMLT